MGRINMGRVTISERDCVRRPGIRVPSTQRPLLLSFEVPVKK